MKKKKPWNYKNLTGIRFRRLVAIEDIGTNQKGKTMWKCKCDCGNNKITFTSYLTGGRTKSCGCLHRDVMSKIKFKHGCVKTSEYMAWKAMKGRCYNQNNSRYNTYGARGIIVCSRWLNKEKGFINFLNDIGKKPSKEYTLDRRDNDGNYEPNNCRWLINTEQGKNKSNKRLLTCKGEALSLTEWAEKTGIDKKLIHRRIKLGWSEERALTQPVRRIKK